MTIDVEEVKKKITELLEKQLITYSIHEFCLHGNANPASVRMKAGRPTRYDDHVYKRITFEVLIE